MIIKYSKLRTLSTPLFSKDTIKSVLSIDAGNDIETISIKNLLSFNIEFKGEDLDTKMKYVRFMGTYYILSVERDRVILFWGLKKVSGIKMYLINKKEFNNQIGNSDEDEIEDYYEDDEIQNLLKGAIPSHIGFLSDDTKLFFLNPYQNYVNYKNEPIQVSNPTSVENFIKFKIK